MRNLKLFIGLLLVMCCLTSIHAQQKYVSFKGVVADEVDKISIPFANVVLKNSKGFIYTGCATNFDGEFALDSIEADNYQLEVSFTGYKTMKSDIDLNESSLNYKVELIEDTVTIFCHVSCCFIIDEDLPADTLAEKMEESSADYKLYPNPVQSLINLENKAIINEVIVSDINGTTVLHLQELSKKNMQIDVSSLSSGTFILSFRVGEIWKTEKFIKL